ncbi:MAG: galactokinase [Nocardioidaceae bacterium]
MPDMPVDRTDAGDPTALAEAVAARFLSLHGRRPQGVFAAPGRVNLIGEHTDYNGGLCLPVALPHATYAACAPREDDLVTVRSMQQDEPWEGRLGALGPGDVDGWVGYVTGVVWALQQDGVQPPGLDLVLDGRVPLGAGLSSSAALECSVALAVCAAAGVDVDDALRRRLVGACMRAEAEVAGAPTGGMDQTVALLAVASRALLLDCRDWSTEQVPWEPAEAGLDLLVVDTRAAHSLTDGGYASRRADCEAAARALGVGLLRDVTDQDGALKALDADRVRRRVRHVFTEIARVEQAVAQLRAGDYAGLGRSFVASHESLRDDYEVSCPELDAVVETALAHGALGARMTGGGFGGSAIALVPHDGVDAVEQAVADAFARAGWTAPGFLTATPAGGARRLL